MTARRCGTSWRTIRATSCSRSTRTSCTHRRWASCTCRSASASRCSRAATVRALRLLPGLRAARPLQHRSARAFGEILAEAYERHGDVDLRSRHHRGGRWPALHHRAIASHGRRRSRTSTRALERQLAEAARSWDDRLREALRRSSRRGRGPARCSAATATPFPPAIATASTREAARGRHRSASRPVSPAAVALNLYRRAEPRRSALHRFKAVPSPASRSPLSDILPMLENMGLRVLDRDALPASRRRRRRRRLDARLRLISDDGATIDLEAARARFTRRSSASGAAQLENDGFNRLVAARRPRAGARSPSCAPMPSTCARPASPSARPTWRRRWRAIRAIARALVELFRRALRSRQRRDRADAPATTPSSSEHRDGARRRREPRRGPHPAPLPQRWSRRRCAPTSTSATRTGGAKAYISFKLDSPRDRRAAAAAAARRDLRLQPARRGHPPARRQGGARRHPLVRPARGLPHRGARPDEGADGEERGHRAGRLQGRLRAQAAAAPARPRAAPGRGHRVLQDPHARPARHHRQPRDGDGVVPPPDVVRHDGDDPYLVVAADKGTATFSDIANGVSAEYGFWLGDAFASGGSAGYDHKEMGITARGAWEIGQAPLPRARQRHPDQRLHRGRRRRHVGRRVRQRHAAVARTSGCSPPSTTATSSSIPIPIRRGASPSASGCSTCRARPGPTTTRR